MRPWHDATEYSQQGNTSVDADARFNEAVA